MTAWDDLLSTVDHYAMNDVPDYAETILLPLVEQAMADRTIDRELHPHDVARWLVGLTLGLHALRDRDLQTDADLDAADMRLIITRWLHPSRPKV